MNTASMTSTSGRIARRLMHRGSASGQGLTGRAIMEADEEGRGLHMNRPHAALVLAAVRTLQPEATTKAVAELMGLPTDPYGLRVLRETLFAMYVAGVVNAPNGR